jgi:DNA-binding XRE family transcriptional regulator
MTSAEFVCARELLGLPINWLADHLGVSKRAIYRWEAGTYQIPETAAKMLRDLVYETSKLVGRTTLEVQADNTLCHTTFRDSEQNPPGGMPASWHRMVTARAAERTGKSIKWFEQ